MRLIGPNFAPTEVLMPYIVRIHESGTEANGGMMREQLEQMLSAMTDARHVVSLCNATLAIELTLRAVAEQLNCNRTLTVLIPSVTYVASGLATLRAGMIPLVVDVDRCSLELTPKLARDRLQSERFDIAMPVCVFGQPLKDGWDQFADSTSIPVVIDAAGAILGQRASANPRIHTVWSLHATKPVSAGEGGAVGTADDFIASFIRSASQFGPMDCSTNAKLSEYSAAVAIASIETLNERMMRLQQIEHWYQNRLITQWAHGRDHHKTGFMNLKMPTSEVRDLLASHMRSSDVPCKLWYHPYLHADPRFVPSRQRDRYPIAEDAMNRLIGIPFSPGMTEMDVDIVCRCIESAI